MTEVLPDGCVDIMFIRHGNKMRAIYIGTPLSADTPAHYHLFPKMMWYSEFVSYRKSDMDAALLCQRATECFSGFLEVSGERELIEQICTCMDFQKQIRIFMQYYLPEYQKVSAELLNKNNPSFYMLRQIIKSKGNVRIQTLSEEMAFSLRHLNELFRTAYGVSPKEFEK